MRRRQAREGRAELGHHDGLSSDDELPSVDEASLGKVRAEVTIGVTWGGAGVHGQPDGEPADAVQRGGDHPCVVVEGDDGELGQEHGEQGLASSSSLSARDSATAYQAWRHASRGGQAAGR